MYYFATLFDKNYLTRGLALYNSMQKHIDSFVLYVLALDQEVVDYIEKQNSTTLKAIKLSDIETKYPELIEAKNNRKLVEYYFTLSPVLPLYMLETFPEINFITTLDADIFFFSNPKPIFDKFKNYSILITAHDFAQNISDKIIFGKYNVSFQSFRQNKEGITCLKKWKQQCLKWCYDKKEGDKFADQKYLDTWLDDYDKVLVLVGNGAGIAPWNVSRYKITRKNKIIYCNNNKLIFYHFHGLRFVNSKIIIHALEHYKVELNEPLKKYLYLKYLKLLHKLQRKDKFVFDQTVRSDKDAINLYHGFYFLFNLYLLDINYYHRSSFLGKKILFNYLKIRLI